MNTEKLIELVQSERAREFRKSIKNQDLQKLLFKQLENEEKKALIIQQLQREKLAGKLPEWTDNPHLIFPIGISTEQSSSQATALLKSKLIPAGNKLLDICGGMGVDTYYLSRKFKQIRYVERDESLCKVASHNFKILGADEVSTFCGDGIEELYKSDADVIYADPARRSSKGKVFLWEDLQPDIIPHLDELCKGERMALIKGSPMMDISQSIQQLKWVVEVWVISYKNECREVCYLLSRKGESLRIKTFNISESATQFFESTFPYSANPKGISQLHTYLYEPNASIQKAGLVNALSEQMELPKLHYNTQLLSGSFRADFPGKCFEIIEVLKPYHKKLKGGRFNVISRNFPDKASLIEKKLKLKGSEKDYLLATRLADESLVFIVAQLKQSRH